MVWNGRTSSGTGTRTEAAQQPAAQVRMFGNQEPPNGDRTVAVLTLSAAPAGACLELRPESHS